MSRHFYGKPLTVLVVDGRLVIEIGVDVLAHAATYAEWANRWDDHANDYIRTFAIVDADAFAGDVQHAMLREREDGSTPLSDFLDRMMEAALDDGAESCEYEQRIKTGETAAIETWARRKQP